MSLYAIQKIIYEINRQPDMFRMYQADTVGFLAKYKLTEEESYALRAPDVGLLYVLGVNGQLLMHFAAACGYGWDAYLEAMRKGVALHGPVRDGIYAMKGKSS